VVQEVSGQVNDRAAVITEEAVAAHAAKQRVALDTARKQLEYAARPILAIWVDSHCSVPSRFNTVGEALDFFHGNWARIRARVAREKYNASNLQQSFIEGPGFRWSGRDVMLAADVSSY
jgi:hypothetical protein